MNSSAAVVLAVALGAGMLAGCEQAPAAPASSTNSSSTNSFPAQATPQAPASTGSKAGGAPVQGQVDTKEPAQRKAFETSTR
jgi:hypothetical protein